MTEKSGSWEKKYKIVHLKIINIAVLKNVLLKISICYEVLYIYVTNITKTNHLATRAINGIMDQDVQNPRPARSIDGIMDQDVQNPVPDSGKAQICGVVTPVIRIPTTHIW